MFAACDECGHTPVEASEPLKFHDDVWVHLAPNTSADAYVLDQSGGFKTTLTDPDGNDWLITTEGGFVAYDFLKKGYEDAWFVTSANQGQRFFCYAFPAKKNVGDLKLDEPSRCSVYLDAGNQMYARLERTADEVPCPTIQEYEEWLPRAESHVVPYRIP